MTKSKINTSTAFCFLEKQDAHNMLSDACCSYDESLLLLVMWDDERAAKFTAAENKKYKKHSSTRKGLFEIAQLSKVSNADWTRK